VELSQQAISLLQRSYAPNITPNDLMQQLHSNISQHSIEDHQSASPFPGDGLDTVYLFLHVGLFADTHTDPHDMMMQFIHAVQCPPHPKLLPCIRAWTEC